MFGLGTFGLNPVVVHLHDIGKEDRSRQGRGGVVSPDLPVSIEHKEPLLSRGLTKFLKWVQVPAPSVSRVFSVDGCCFRLYVTEATGLTP